MSGEVPLEAVAAEHQARQNAIRAAQVALIVQTFRRVDPEHVVLSWIGDGVGEKIYTLVSVAQELMASESGAYVARALAAQGVVADVPTIQARQFAGLASDNRDLGSLLAGAPLRVANDQRAGMTGRAAMRSGEAWLRMVADTQITDAGRAADSAAIAGLKDARRTRDQDLLARAGATRGTGLSDRRKADIARRLAARRPPTPTMEPPKPAGPTVSVGYIRMLTPPSCDRCAVLAGRWYRWNQGFKRHPMCDCRHIPATEAIAGDLTTDPKAYFDSLSSEQQDEYFGKANAAAIRDGSDIYQVVNAQRAGAMFTADDGRRYTSEGTTRRGVAGTRRRARGGPPVLRPTVWQIYRDANGDRNVARQMLVRFGYILS